MLAILQELKSIGVTVTPVGCDRIMIEPASIVSPALKERLRAQKSAVLAALLSRRTSISQAECRHCNGAGVCNCPACNLRRTADAVPCLTCRSAERQVWLAATRPEGCWHCSGTGKCNCLQCHQAGACTACDGVGDRKEWLQ